MVRRHDGPAKAPEPVVRADARRPTFGVAARQTGLSASLASLMSALFDEYYDGHQVNGLHRTGFYDVQEGVGRMP